MYQEMQFDRAHTALKRFVACYAVLSALVLAGIIVCLIVRTILPLYVLVGVFTILSIFLWEIFGSRIARYWRFLKDLRQGRESVAEGTLASLDDKDTTRDGVEFRAVRLIVGDETDKQGGRLLYVDSTMLPLPVQPGQKVQVTLYGNFIKDIHGLEDK